MEILLLFFDWIDNKDEGSLQKEQEYLINFDDDVTSYMFRLKRLAVINSDPPDPAIDRKMMT